jgi:murein DD-endopeptidase MepM/ murein hydrolase activator NlpD
MSYRWLLAVLVCASLLGAGWPSSRPRSRSGMRPNLRASALVLASVWGAEPESPEHVDVGKLAHALREVCGMMPPGRAERYAEWMVQEGTRNGEDPFLLAAITYRMSRCLPDAQTAEGVGLTALPLTMYRQEIRGRKLDYVALEGGAEVMRHRELGAPFLEQTLLMAEHNLAWAGALLAMWREQHAMVDARFEQVPHRHHVSHFIWGDRVKSARAEDRIFTDRRRLLLQYGVQLPTPTRTFHGATFGLPLEGGPRVVSSQPGADRDEGLRVHRGVDVEAAFGEPVLAMADGRVSFAGVDYPGLFTHESLSPTQIAQVPREKLGRGGRYVCITHVDAHGDEAWLRSCSMHLENVFVREGQTVKRGDVIGTVGRTGMRRSAPHLHLEIKSDKRIYDARDVITGLLLGDPPRDVAKKKRRKLRALPPQSSSPIAATQ